MITVLFGPVTEIELSPTLLLRSLPRDWRLLFVLKSLFQVPISLGPNFATRAVAATAKPRGEAVANKPIPFPRRLRSGAAAAKPVAPGARSPNPIEATPMPSKRELNLTFPKTVPFETCCRKPGPSISSRVRSKFS